MLFKNSIKFEFAKSTKLYTKHSTISQINSYFKFSCFLYVFSESKQNLVFIF